MLPLPLLHKPRRDPVRWEWFVAEARPGHLWTHESSSLQMLDYIIEEHDLMPKFREHGLCEKDVIFIKVSVNFLRSP